MKIAKRNEEETFVIPKTENEIDNKLELLKYTSEVQSRIKKDISSDFILAKLNEKDKEGIIEMTSNAYFCKKIGEILKKKAKERGKWKWSIEKNRYIKVDYNEKYLKEMELLAEGTFDSFMTRIYMTVLLNRNVEKNHLLKTLTGQADDYDTGEEKVELKSNIEKVKKVIESEKQKGNNQV